MCGGGVESKRRPERGAGGVVESLAHVGPLRRRALQSPSAAAEASTQRATASVSLRQAHSLRMVVHGSGTLAP